jgi:cytochrome c oxidase assembly protein subunit 15
MNPLARRAPHDTAVGVWLLVVCALLIAMILLGGATRLTESGLSITEWKPVSGALPPLGQKEWADAFAKYRATEQYRALNSGMSLGEFQFIFWWEWSHRFLGRLIGVVFALPFAIFWMAGRLKGRFWACLLLLVLGGLQGAIGWWMVESGLAGRIAVAPERLATHLGLAFLILAFAWRLALGALNWPRQPGRIGAPSLFGAAFVVALYVQILAGALMAGSGAGRAYPDWPTIGGEWLPAAYASLSPFWRNLVENHAAIQFNHRTLGYGVAALMAIIAAGALVRGHGPARTMALLTLLAALGQIGLGISTVMHAAPLGLSLAHQGGAIILWLLAHAMMRANAMR